MLGIVSIFLLVACGIGVLTAIAGLITGIIALFRSAGKGRAITGIVLSVLTLVAAVALYSWFVSNFEECFNQPTQSEVQRCVEQKLGVTSPQ